MTAKLTLYNDTLLILGQERLASLAEASTARYALDDAYPGAVSYCLEQGFWNFAMRAVQLDSSASVTPTFGYAYAFNKPTDFIRLLSMSTEETMRTPLLDFVDELDFWFANSDPLYAKYVSDDTAYGRDLSIWTQTFSDFVALRMAKLTCKRITGSEPSDNVLKREQKAEAKAKSLDAMDEPPGFAPVGSWVRSRGGTSNINGTKRGL